jgi:antitoxin ParD1/3/4
VNRISISLPQAMTTFIDTQLEEGGFTSRSKYVRRPARRDMDRQQLRSLLLIGAASPATEPADNAYFDAMRARILGSGQQAHSSTSP